MLFFALLHLYVGILNEIVYNVSIYLIATKKINNIILIAFFVFDIIYILICYFDKQIIDIAKRSYSLLL